MGRLILLDTAIIIPGMIAALFVPKEWVMPVIMAPMLAAIFFNLIIGATNSPENIDSRFRRWLFKKD